MNKFLSLVVLSVTFATALFLLPLSSQAEDSASSVLAPAQRNGEPTAQSMTPEGGSSNTNTGPVNPPCDCNLSEEPIQARASHNSQLPSGPNEQPLAPQPPKATK